MEESEGTDQQRSEFETSSELEAEYEIVEHEQAHAIAATKANWEMSLLEEEAEESRWSHQAAKPQTQGNLSEPFLNTFAGMINRDNLDSILKEQSHM